MTTSTTRTLSTFAIGLALSALAAQAVPIGGLPDRDVVRNPYGSVGGSFGSSIVPQSGNIIGPNLGFGSGITPPLFGGGGGGGGAAFAFSSAPVIGGGGALPPQALGSNPTSNSNTGGGVPFVLPPTSNGPSSLPFTAPYTAQTTVAITQSVPEGGSSLILMGCGLLSLLVLRRRMFTRES
jgi:hypothetical protein